MSKQVFLGGACGRTTWRQDIAIPILEARKVTFHNPQMGVGEWTADDEAGEMLTKDEADVLLFVISNETRGVAAQAEAAYLIGCGTPVSVCLQFVEAGLSIEGKEIDAYEADDLNRGRLFVKSMAQKHNIPVFDNVKEATEYACQLVDELSSKLTARKLEEILSRVDYKNTRFQFKSVEGGFLIYCVAEELCAYTQKPLEQIGRMWFVSFNASLEEVIQTVFKAVVTWQEHEVRENFKVDDMRIYGPHFKVDELLGLCKSRKEKLKV